MKKAAFSVLVCVLTFFATQVKAQQHPHQHMTYSIDTLLNDPNGTGRVVLEVTMTVDLSGHPECIINNSSMYIAFETWDDHWIMVDENGTSTTITRTIEYNVNDDPYWLFYGFSVEYADGTYEEEDLNIYF